MIAQKAIEGTERFLGLNVNNPGVQDNIERALVAARKAGPSREFSMVITKLEEARLWLKAAEQTQKP